MDTRFFAKITACSHFFNLCIRSWSRTKALVLESAGDSGLRYAFAAFKCSSRSTKRFALGIHRSFPPTSSDVQHH